MGFRVLGMPWGILGGSLGTRIGGAGGGAPLVYLWKFTFSVPEAAPLTSPIQDDEGNGYEIVLVDSANVASIAGGVYTFPDETGAGDPRWYENTGTARLVGRAVIARAFTKEMRLGWDNARNDTTPDQGAYFWDSTQLTTILTNVDEVTQASVWYQLAIVWRTTGQFYLIKGGTFTDWTLVGVDNTEPQVTNYFTFAAGTRAANLTSVDYAKCFDLPAPWNTDNGIATEVLAGARAPGDTFSHTADCLIEMEVVTLPGGGQIELWFRIQDATNYWAVTVNAAGDLELDEVVAGVTTQRGSAAGVVANSDRIVIVAFDETINVFEAGTRRINYTSASNFKTEQSGELDTEGAGGAVADIITWPRNPDGTLLDTYAEG